jgi:hypothetical protein
LLTSTAITITTTTTTATTHPSFQVPFLGEVIPEYHRSVLHAAGSCIDDVSWHWCIFCPQNNSPSLY